MWGDFNLAFFASSGGLSRLRVFSLVLSLVVDTKGYRKLLRLQQIGKITTQQARTNQVNKVECILKIPASIYLL